MSEGGHRIAPSTLAWDGDRLVHGGIRAGVLLAAESWLVSDGSVLAFDMHVARLADSVATRGGDAEAATAAMRALPEQVQAEGRWFPRVDVHDDGIVAFVREAPAVSRRAVLVTASHDPRRVPTIKGPDLAESLLLRAEAEARGANEAVILAGDAIVDGTTSALLWWRGDTLVTPTQELERVDSVTARATIGIASALGVPLDAERATPDSIEGCELWVLSALHGIRGVERWIDGPTLARPSRADTWHARLEALRRPWT